MSVKILVTIGDSWPAGAELQNTACAFPNLIANNLEIESINLAEPGTSADQALYKLLNLSLDIDWQHTLLLFCLTGITRSMYIDNSCPKEIHPMAKTTVAQFYYKYIHSNQLDQFNRMKNILSAQQYCAKKGCELLFVNNWDSAPNHNLIDQSKFYNKTLIEILNINQKLDDKKLDWNLISQHEFIKPNTCHPNETGHQKIAKELSQWIKEKLHDKPIS